VGYIEGVEPSHLGKLFGNGSSNFVQWERNGIQSGHEADFGGKRSLQIQVDEHQALELVQRVAGHAINVVESESKLAFVRVLHP